MIKEFIINYQICNVVVENFFLKDLHLSEGLAVPAMKATGESGTVKYKKNERDIFLP